MVEITKPESAELDPREGLLDWKQTVGLGDPGRAAGFGM